MISVLVCYCNQKFATRRLNLTKQFQTRQILEGKPRFFHLHPTMWQPMPHAEGPDWHQHIS